MLSPDAISTEPPDAPSEPVEDPDRRDNIPPAEPRPTANIRSPDFWEAEEPVENPKLPLDALLEPVNREAEPDEDFDALVPNKREPDEPVELDPVITSMAPPSNDSLEPLRICTRPPVPADELPTRTEIDPETPARVLPDNNDTSPEF